eukprot:354799-Pelagomonas_calceolata.AAC.3
MQLLCMLEAGGLYPGGRALQIGGTQACRNLAALTPCPPPQKHQQEVHSEAKPGLPRSDLCMCMWHLHMAPSVHDHHLLFRTFTCWVFSPSAEAPAGSPVQLRLGSLAQARVCFWYQHVASSGIHETLAPVPACLSLCSPLQQPQQEAQCRQARAA